MSTSTNTQTDMAQATVSTTTNTSANARDITPESAATVATAAPTVDTAAIAAATDTAARDASYISLNALTRFKTPDGRFNFSADKEACKRYIEQEIMPRIMHFESLPARLAYMVQHNYYDHTVINAYSTPFIQKLYAIAAEEHFEFTSLMGAMKFYIAYALHTDDGAQILEQFEDRVVMCAMFLANGNEELAKQLVKDMMANRFQPATPTFLNAGKKRRGEYISCYLLRVEDTMESIARGISTSLQLSKRGGGVALCLTNLRETAAPIKGFENQASGVVPVMKLLEDTFSYANQLGQRQGAGAVYLHAHHPDIMRFLDTKRENADEKVRIKSLSLGVVIPDVTFRLAQQNKDMALFSPYDVKREYNVALSDLSVSEKYDELCANPRIHKTYISARKFFQTIAELQFESGYPYIMFEDTVNYCNPHKRAGRIVMSNLCSEIAQVSTPSSYTEDLSFTHVGVDVCCNLGSINIARAMDDAPHFGSLVRHAIFALDRVSRSSDLACAPSVKKGNNLNHAVGLGAMNLHGFLATHHIYYNSPEAVDFVDMFFYAMAYHAFSASCDLAQTYGSFSGFSNSEYADGSYFDKYTGADTAPSTPRVRALLAELGLTLPTRDDWVSLVEKIKVRGLANAHLMAVAPTGSISYLSSCTPSLQPVVSAVETRKEGKIGRVYVPAYKITNDNYRYYQDGAYEVGYEAIINIVAAAQKHVDQAISLTLFMTSQATTRDLNKAYIYAFKKRCKSIYYVRIRQDVLEGSEHLENDEVIAGGAGGAAGSAGGAAGSSSSDDFVCTGSSECQVCMI